MEPEPKVNIFGSAKQVICRTFTESIILVFWKNNIFFSRQVPLSTLVCEITHCCLLAMVRSSCSSCFVLLLQNKFYIL